MTQNVNELIDIFFIDLFYKMYSLSSEKTIALLATKFILSVIFIFTEHNSTMVL